MKILQIFGAVVAVHLLAFIFIFASPGCQSGPKTMPTPDATMPASAPADAAFTTPNTTATPVDLGTPAVAYNPASPSGHATPTRPGSANAVAVTPAKAVENVAPVSTYTVERGDSLWSIAKKKGLTVAELAKANSVTTGTALKPGRKLIIPGKPGAPAPAATETAGTTTTVAAAPAPAAARAASGEVTKHTVTNGESLGVIARKYGVSVGELAAANSITDPSKVRVGQQLVIPGGKAPAKSSTAAKSSPAATKTVSSTGSAPAAAATETSAKTAAPAPAASTHFDLSPPPPGQDLDSGLKPATESDVPTIKVEEPATAPKN